MAPETQHLKQLHLGGIPQRHYVVELTVVALAYTVAGRAPASLACHYLLLELGRWLDPLALQ
jgi:hypothetical protein